MYDKNFSYFFIVKKINQAISIFFKVKICRNNKLRKSEIWIFEVYNKLLGYLPSWLSEILPGWINKNPQNKTMSNKKALISFCILMALGTICLSLEVEIVSENTMRKIFDESILFV